MTEQELTYLVDFHENILMDDNIEESCLMFRDESLAYYQNNPNAATQVPYDVIDQISEEQLMKAIKKGLQVENYTRITGYMARVSSFNLGKRAELKDRNRMELDGRAIAKDTQPGCNSACPIAQGVD